MEDLKEKMKFIMGYKPENGGQMLEEQFVPANMSELNQAMQQDRELYTFLNTPAKDLPDNYKYLVQEITPDIANKTLLNIIQTSIEYPNPYGGKLIPYFSIANGKLVGFAGYTVKGNEVFNIKMFSFSPKQGDGAVLIRDLNNLLGDLIKKYKKVSWFAAKENPANRIYQAAIKEYKGSFYEEGDDIYYCIENGNTTPYPQT